jgi:hypothetical protein
MLQPSQRLRNEHTFNIILKEQQPRRSFYRQEQKNILSIGKKNPEATTSI